MLRFLGNSFKNKSGTTIILSSEELKEIEAAIETHPTYGEQVKLLIFNPKGKSDTHSFALAVDDQKSDSNNSSNRNKKEKKGSATDMSNIIDPDDLPF